VLCEVRDGGGKTVAVGSGARRAAAFLQPVSTDPEMRQLPPRSGVASDEQDGAGGQGDGGVESHEQKACNG
jgi:hypothetical protein